MGSASQVKLREYLPSDRDELRSLISHGLAERWGEDFDPDLNPDLADIGTSYVRAGACVLVVEVGGALAATGTLIAEDPTSARIVRMSVSSTHRRRGLARMIVHELLERGRSRGFTRVRVSTDIPWASAIAFYRSCGFSEVGMDSDEVHFEINLVDR